MLILHSHLVKFVTTNDDDDLLLHTHIYDYNIHTLYDTITYHTIINNIHNLLNIKYISNITTQTKFIQYLIFIIFMLKYILR